MSERSKEIRLGRIGFIPTQVQILLSSLIVLSLIAGDVPEWSKGVDSSSSGLYPHWFESSHHHYTFLLHVFTFIFTILYKVKQN